MRKPLTLVANTTTVRLLDGRDEIARHARSYEAKRVIEDPRHIAALLQAKQTTRPEPPRDLLARTVPQTQTLFERLALRGDNLHTHVARLRSLLDDYGPEELQAAVQQALDTGALSAASVAHILDQRRRAQRRKPRVRWRGPLRFRHPNRNLYAPPSPCSDARRRRMDANVFPRPCSYIDRYLPLIVLRTLSGRISVHASRM